MNEIFVDTQYFVARINPRDQWHTAAVEIEELLSAARLITTETVLHEILNYFADDLPSLRIKGIGFVYQLLEQQQFMVVMHSETAFRDGLQLYSARLDKGYSLTDCISMNVCSERGIREVLTHDHHFEQEGFTILL